MNTPGSLVYTCITEVTAGDVGSCRPRQDSTPLLYLTGGAEPRLSRVRHENKSLQQCGMLVPFFAFMQHTDRQELAHMQLISCLTSALIPSVYNA